MDDTTETASYQIRLRTGPSVSLEVMMEGVTMLHCRCSTRPGLGLGSGLEMPDPDWLVEAFEGLFALILEVVLLANNELLHPV